MVTLNDLDVLNTKVENVLMRDNVVDDGDEISIRTASKALSYGMSPYNDCFIREEKKAVKAINRNIKRSNIFRCDVPHILNLCPSVTNDGLSEIEVLFTDYDRRYKGRAIIHEDMNIDFEGLRSEYNEERTRKLLNKYNDIYETMFKVLKNFKEEYPDNSYTWNADLSKGKQDIDDGFLSIYLYLERVDNPGITFSRLEDINIGGAYYKKDSELNNKIDFYKYDIMRKMKVNINDLNPLYQSIIRKQLELNNGFQKTKKK